MDCSKVGTVWGDSFPVLPSVGAVSYILLSMCLSVSILDY